MGDVGGVFFPPFCPIRPARRVLINNSSFNLIPHSHSQCVSHIFNNGAAVNNPPTHTHVLWWGGRAGVWKHVEERKRSRVHHQSASPQVDNEQMHAFLPRIRVWDYLSLSSAHWTSAITPPPAPHCHRSEAGDGCPLIKHLFSCQWEGGQSELHSNNNQFMYALVAGLTFNYKLVKKN